MKERLLFLICFLCISFMLKAADKPVIKISTENVDLIYRVGCDLNTRLRNKRKRMAENG